MRETERVVHDAAASGFQLEADTYAKARPSHHPELVDRFVRLYGQGQVVELGAGTGIFTGQLVDSGCTPAQAFHWFDHEAALTEIRRILEPGGHLVCVWNVRDESVDWVAGCTTIMDRLHQLHRSPRCRRAGARPERHSLGR